MSNPPKAKGTANETRVLRRLQAIWPAAHRSPANTFSQDIVGLPLVVECKHCKRWDIPEWVRKLRQKPLLPWALFVKDGDSRRAGTPGAVLVVDEDFGLELLAAWETVNGMMTEEIA